MARKPKSITITPKLIEFEDHIIRVPNIASVTIGPDALRRRWAVVLFLFALGQLFLSWQAWTFARYGMPNAQAGAIITLLLAIGALYLAYRLWTRLSLLISKSDSRFTLLTDKNPVFMRDVMMRIREALLADEASPVIYQVNVQAERIDRLDASSTVVSNSAGAMVVGGSVTDSTLGTMTGADAMAGGPPSGAGFGQSLNGLIDRAREQAVPLTRRAVEMARSAMPGRLSSGEPQPGTMGFMPSAGPGYAPGSHTHAPTQSMVNAPGAVMIGGPATNNAIATSVQMAAISDFDAVIHLLARHPQTRQDILDYLAPVRDHLAGGSTTRDDALQRWAWLAAQAAGVLSGLDGLVGLVERVSRVLRG